MSKTHDSFVRSDGGVYVRSPFGVKVRDWERIIIDPPFPPAYGYISYWTQNNSIDTHYIAGFQTGGGVTVRTQYPARRLFPQGVGYYIHESFEPDYTSTLGSQPKFSRFSLLHYAAGGVFFQTIENYNRSSTAGNTSYFTQITRYNSASTGSADWGVHEAYGNTSPADNYPWIKNIGEDLSVVVAKEDVWPQHAFHQTQALRMLTATRADVITWPNTPPAPASPMLWPRAATWSNLVNAFATTLINARDWHYIVGDAPGTAPPAFRVVPIARDGSFAILGNGYNLSWPNGEIPDNQADVVCFSGNNDMFFAVDRRFRKPDHWPGRHRVTAWYLWKLDPADTAPVSPAWHCWVSDVNTAENDRILQGVSGICGRA